MMKGDPENESDRLCILNGDSLRQFESLSYWDRKQRTVTHDDDYDS